MHKPKNKTINQFSFDAREYRKTLGSFVTGVTVVTTLKGPGDPIGFTANSFTSVSLDPPLISFCLAKSSSSRVVFTDSKAFAINILAENQDDVSELFSSPVDNRFAEVVWHSESTGSPIINNTAAWLDCELYKIIDAGDHLIILGRAVAFSNSTVSPLGYLRGNYIRFSLSQQAVMAIEDPKQRTFFTAFVGNEAEVLLIEDDNGLSLPRASCLGHKKDENSLIGKLNNIGLTIDTESLFPIFENKKANMLSIYYRALIENTDQITGGKFYPFSAIPFESVSDAITVYMLKRYIKEQESDAFGRHGLTEPDKN